MSRATILVLTLLVSHAASAHEFWLQPEQFSWQPNESIPLSLLTGHGVESERSKIPARRILRLDAAGPSGQTLDLRSNLHLGGVAGDAELTFGAPGAYVVVLATDNQARSDLPAERFNNYLRAEGLTPALTARELTGRTYAEGSERYSRQAKAIVRVGAPGDQSQVTRPHGLRLEIVPEVSPYAVPRSSQLPVRVWFEGKPLPGALVKMSYLARGSEAVDSHITDADGRVVFDMPSQGHWLLHAAWTQPLPSADEADFDTVFASLTFGFAN
ncbi:MAG: DUF4198 domain-containing protein [Steroidobacter sp.]